MSVIHNYAELQKFIKENTHVLADFHAEWCGPCKAMSPLVHKLPSEYPNLKVCTINIDHNQDIAAVYKIKGIPLFVLYHNGVAKKRLSGADPKALTAAVAELCSL